MNPTFNHYLFETIAALVRHVTAVHAEAIPAFEEALFPLIRQMLDQDVVEFGPYAFQLLSQLLGIRGGGGSIPGQYLEILPPLFMPLFWERPGYIPALTPLVQNYLRCAGPSIISNGQLMPILGIFQKLIASKANDHHGAVDFLCPIKFWELRVTISLRGRLCAACSNDSIAAIGVASGEPTHSLPASVPAACHVENEQVCARVRRHDVNFCVPTRCRHSVGAFQRGAA